MEATANDRLVVETFLRQRTEESFFHLFRAFCGRIRRFFLLRGLDMNAAEDLAQEVFLKIYCKTEDLREADRFFGWMYAIARNELISHWRQQQSRITETPLGNTLPETCDTLLMDAGILPKLRISEWLSRLEASDRELLILRFVEGLSYKELAVALGIPVGTVKWRISELRRKLTIIVQVSPVEANGCKNQLSAALEANCETPSHRGRVERLSGRQEHARGPCPA